MTAVVSEVRRGGERLAGAAGLVAAVALPALLLATPWAARWWLAAAAVTIPAALVALRWPLIAWWAAVAAAPMSVELPVALGDARLSAPSEPLMVLALLAWAAHRWRGDATPLPVAWRHPVALLAAAVLGWTALSAACGTAPVVGLKLLVVRSLQAATCLGLGLVILRRPADLARLALIGSLALAPVIALAVVRLTASGFDSRMVYNSAAPFFPNRLELTVLAGFWLVAGTFGPPSRPLRPLWIASLAVPGVAILLLSSRAGWLCLAVGLAVRALTALRPRPAALAAAGVAAAVLLGGLAVDAARWWDERSSPAASSGALDPFWRSVATSFLDGDASALERLNRWRCALVMAAERPLTGFGPGAFEGAYGRYQRTRDLTPASTFAGDRGDAHSQPLGTLAEQGSVGLALELALLGAALACGVRAAWRAPDRQRRTAAAAWTGAVAGLAAAGLFVGWSDLPATGPAAWLALAALVRLEAGDTP